MTDDNDGLKDPPNGGKMRLPDDQAQPWEALGISRATWYRQGKPTEKPGALGEWFRGGELKYWRSKRTVERVNRIAEFDYDLWSPTLEGHIKPAQAERIICDPVEYQHFLQWFAEQLDLTEYVVWTVKRQLDDLEDLHPKRRAPLGIRRLGQGETVIYLPARVEEETEQPPAFASMIIHRRRW
jgi:hypothetical protein